MTHDPVPCPFCKNISTSRAGMSRGKALRWCKLCKRRWVVGARRLEDIRGQIGPQCPRCAPLQTKTIQKGYIGSKKRYFCYGCDHSWSAGGRTHIGLRPRKLCPECARWFTPRKLKSQIYCGLLCQQQKCTRDLQRFNASDKKRRRDRFIMLGLHKKGIPPRLGTKWARFFDACLSCGETSKPHHAHGYCKSCYSANKRHKDTMDIFQRSLAAQHVS